MSQLRDSAPLLDAYLSYFEAKRTPFTIPGHKQQAARLDAGLGQVVDVDIPLSGGLDEVKLTGHVLQQAEALAAQLWGGDFARFSTGGSTHANQASIFALGKPGDRVAVTRTAHRSVLSALVLAGLEPIWMSPETGHSSGVPTGIAIETLQAALEHKPIAVLLTEPGYLGTMSDLSALIELAHNQHIPVIVDAAWGAHFGFHPMLPSHAMQLGADALITSMHKAMPGYSASALLVARTTYLNADRLEHGFEMTHTTSPAGAPLASIDGCRALLETRGEELIDELLVNIAGFKARVQAEIAYPIFSNPREFADHRFDPAKLVLRANELGTTGIAIEHALLAYGIRVEMADQDTVVFLATIADCAQDFDTLATALVPILKNLQSVPRHSATALSWSVVPEIGLSLRDAFFAETTTVTRAQAEGRISADLIAPYPPGVAVVAPGEVLTAAIIEGLTASRAAGVRIAYATDPSLATYRVVR
ncbi:MAG: aminotransferase class V-fold PLP-dependent enzyme [Actinomycetota bacterium]|nr:aminotransferase class V-fold PLP-dependent enzyme [Actinomycetota bacterium]